MKEILAKLASICLDCLQDELKHVTKSILESYINQDCTPYDCHSCDKKQETPSDGPKAE